MFVGHQFRVEEWVCKSNNRANDAQRIYIFTGIVEDKDEDKDVLDRDEGCFTVCAERERETDIVGEGNDVPDRLENVSRHA